MSGDLEHLVINAVEGECLITKCNGGSDYSYDINITEMDMNVRTTSLVGGELLGTMKAMISMTDSKGISSSKELIVASEGDSSSTRFPTMSEDLLRIMLKDFSKKFISEMKK